MRLLIKLRSVRDNQYEMQYHYHLQSFIYNLLKGSKYHFIHNKEGYKFFCYSNIFPAANILRNNSLSTLIISSPSEGLISYLLEVLCNKQNLEVQIGDMNFRIDNVHKFVVNISDTHNLSLITGTPIIVRIPKEKYEAYGIVPKRNYDYIYWKTGYPLDLFISSIESNLLKKYSEYFHNYHEDHDSISTHFLEYKDDLASYSKASYSLIKEFQFKKQISTRVLMRGFQQVIIGTLWQFSFHNEVGKGIVQFALDCGLGERNSLGFGFMNTI